MTVGFVSYLQMNRNSGKFIRNAIATDGQFRNVNATAGSSENVNAYEFEEGLYFYRLSSWCGTPTRCVSDWCWHYRTHKGDPIYPKATFEILPSKGALPAKVVLDSKSLSWYMLHVQGYYVITCNITFKPTFTTKKRGAKNKSENWNTEKASLPHHIQSNF